MSDFKLTTPVAFIIFNRPDTTARVFAEIARAKPTKLMVIADGPRKDRLGEADRVAKTREIIEHVDWPCEVMTNFSDINLGCRKRVSSGIDWVFQEVEEAIILEDDCLPDPTFFRFCQELLDKYRHNEKVAMISGDNFVHDTNRLTESYYFSRYIHIWGWATWRRAWKLYNHDASYWPIIRHQKKLDSIVHNDAELRYWKMAFDGVYRGLIDTWDYQWVLTCFTNELLSIMPKNNLISNIGFGENATHTTGPSALADLSTHAIDFPLRHPSQLEINKFADEITSKMHYQYPHYLRVTVHKIRRFILGSK